VAALRAAEDLDCSRCLEAFEQASVSGYTVGDEPAATLRETLEVKYSIARRRGLTLTGDREVFLRLSELGPEPVNIISSHFQGAHYVAFFRPRPLRCIGCVVMREQPVPIGDAP
jgi:hypothetical protein